MADGDETATIQHAAAKLTSGDLDSVTDPFALFAEWLAEATANEPNDPTAMALATVDDIGPAGCAHGPAQGLRRQRIRLLHQSGKPQGTCSWRRTRRRRSASTGNRCGGRCASAGRSRRSSPRRPTTISPAARASAGSAPGRASSREPLESRFALEKAVARYTARFAAGAVPRPPHWSGFRLVPAEIEFWRDGAFRLHDRRRFSRRRWAGAGRPFRFFPEELTGTGQRSGRFPSMAHAVRMTDRFADARRNMIERQLVARGITDPTRACCHGEGAARGLRSAGPRGVRLRGQPAADRRGPDHLAALHRCADGGGGAHPSRRRACWRWGPAPATPRRCWPSLPAQVVTIERHAKLASGARAHAEASRLFQCGGDRGRRLARACRSRRPSTPSSSPPARRRRRNR